MEGIHYHKLYQLSIAVILPKQVVNSRQFDPSSTVPSPNDDSCYSKETASDLLIPRSPLVAHSSQAQADLILWHERFGHVNIDCIQKMSVHDSLTDFKLDKPVQLQHPYNGCMLGKKHKSSYTHDLDKQRFVFLGQLLHGDVSGKQTTPSMRGF